MTSGKGKFNWHPGDVQIVRPATRGLAPAAAGRFAWSPGDIKVRQHSVTWDDLANVIDLSAKTAMLEATPAPRGKPGGPGLYGAKGNEHSPYFQQIVKALIEKRGMPPGKAYAIAWGAMRKWSKGGGKVTSEVRAAAAGGLGLEKAAEARAHAHSGTRAAVDLTGPGGWSHGWLRTGTAGMAPEDRADRMSGNLSGHAFSDGADGDEARSAHREAAKAHRQATRLSSSPAVVAHHQKMARLHSAVASGKMYSGNAEKKMSVTWDDVAGVIGLATVVELFNPAEARVPVGSATAGQFSAGAGAQPATGQPAGKGKAPVKPLTAAQKHAAHIAHVAHLNHVSTQKAGLMVTAADDRAKASALIKQRDALVKALASAGGKTSSGQAGATTSANATTATTAPAAASTAAVPATASTTPAAAAKAAAAPKAGSAAAMKAQIAQLNTQISALLASTAQATAQAAKLK